MKILKHFSFVHDFEKITAQRWSFINKGSFYSVFLRRADHSHPVLPNHLSIKLACGQHLL